MFDQHISTRNVPRHVRLTDTRNANQVRVVRLSPCDVHLQIRREKDYTVIALTFEEAKQLAAMLKDAIPSDAVNKDGC